MKHSFCQVSVSLVFGLAMGTVSAETNQEVEVRTLNSGNLILEGIPAIPDEIGQRMSRYLETRSASLIDWTESGDALFVRTRFGNTAQIHRVAGPGMARQQLTFEDEPVGAATRRPGSNLVTFAMDAGGSEFSQLFSLNPDDGSVTLLTDGESRNSSPLWSPDGSKLAFQSTRRDGRSNDIWVMDGVDPDSAGVALEAEGGSYYAPIAFGEDSEQLLTLRYISITNSHALLVDLKTGEQRRIDGGEERLSVNRPAGFDADGAGFFFITDQGSEFNRLAWRGLDGDAETVIITEEIEWNIDGLVMNDSRTRGAFIANEGGVSALYLMDTRTREYAKVDALPPGLVTALGFSSDGRRLALTLNSAQSPSDTWVLELGEGALASRELTRWTFSEVGGLDTDQFVAPSVIEYPSFDEVEGSPRMIPAFVYTPPGEGPHPVIIRIHGGPESQARPSFSSTYQYWVSELGAAVIMPNVRGSSGYGKTYVSLDNGFGREDSVRDIGALLDWIALQPQFDSDRVAVFGGSYGGYMVLASAVNYSDRLRAAVDVVGISNFVTFLENTQDYRRDLRRVEYGDERDPEMRAYLERISPLNNVDQIEVPMFVVQGHNDPRVPVTEAEQVVSALRSNGNTVWYMDALNEGHGYGRKENSDVYRAAVVAFFKAFLLEPDSP
ncbi:MAG: S9 family peptidase [Pseudomonadota bacterium]